MLWNPKKVRFDDILEVNSSDIAAELKSIIHPGDGGDPSAAVASDDDFEEIEEIDDDIDPEDLVVVDSLASLPASSEGGYDSVGEVTSNAHGGIVDDEVTNESLGVNEDESDADSDDDHDAYEVQGHTSDSTDDDNDSVLLLSEVDEEEEVNASPVAAPRRSNRLRGVNRNYAMHTNGLFVKVFFCSDGTVRVPRGYEQAMKSPQAKEWLDAIKVEYDCLVKNGTWEVVDRPANVPVVGCRWVFDLKFNEDGSIKRYKARLVAQGFSQTQGVDYFETFAPVASAVSVRLLLALATIHDWDVRQLDIETAYLNAPVKEEIYMRQVPGFEVPGNKVLKLKRSLYGLKQSGKNWNDYLSDFLLGIGMERSKIDPCLFYFRDTGGKIALLSVYVDDIIITGDATDVINQIIEQLNNKFRVKDLGGVYQLLGMVIVRDRTKRQMRVHQGPYIRRMLREFDISGVRHFDTPTPDDMYAQVIKAAFDGEVRTAEFDYRGAVGCLMHLANCTRPDIAN